LTIQLHGLCSTLWRLELNVAETTCSAVFAHGDTHRGNIASLAEEIADSLFLGVEANVATENSAGHTSLS
jgi:hypothetical protein